MILEKKSISGSAILIGIGVFFIVLLFWNVYKENKLFRTGIINSAVIVDIKQVGSKGTRRCFYEFMYKNRSYEGYVDDDVYRLGDTVKILFDKDSPEKNGDYYYLEKSSWIKRLDK